MQNILISLVGDQTVPNVFLMRDRAFRQIDRYIFITTPQMEGKSRLQHIINATGINDSQYDKVLVKADDLYHIQKELDRLQLKGGQGQYYVNLTSGTKLMSIALYDYFTQPRFRDCSRIFYMPIGRNGYVQVQEEGPPLVCDLTYRISVWEYLASYGIELASARQLLHQPGTYTQSLMPRMQSYRTDSAFAKALHGLRQAYNRNRDKGKTMALKVGDDLAILLEQLEYPYRQEDGLSAADARYLTGGWLEEWAYYKVQTTLGLPESALALNAQVTRPNGQGGNVANECDLLFTYNNTLYILECKTGLGKRGNKLFDEAVYKLATLRGEFGQRVPVFLLTLNELKPAYRQRAALHRIALLGGSSVEDGLEKHLTSL